MPHALPRWRARRPDTVEWAEKSLKNRSSTIGGRPKPAGAIVGNPVGSANFRSSSVRRPCAMPGYDVQIVDEAAKMPANKMGSIVVKLPLPPGCLPTLWQNDKRMSESYLDEFPGYTDRRRRLHRQDGYLIMGRTDDIINVAGHRLSTGGMEEVLARIPTSRNARSSASRTISRASSPVRVRRAEGRRHQAARADREGNRRDGARKDRPGRRLQDRRLRRSTAKTRSGKIPRHDERSPTTIPGPCRRPSTIRLFSTRSPPAR